MDRMNRRGFLECMAWAGTGVVWTATGGILSSRVLPASAAEPAGGGSFSFVQVSDTHVGFKGEANKDATVTLQQVVAKINALPTPPAFVIHTGDLTHGQKAGAFDTVTELLKGVKTDNVLYVPGEHDVFVDGGKEFLGRYAKGGPGWQSFDYKGVHFVGLVNVLKYKGEHIGALGAEQITWLKQDLAGLSSSTPVVVYAHVPLWAVYPAWGWVTEDSQQAMALLTRFGSVTVLNGHIHQVLQKVDGNVTFHTAMSTAFPQPAPGTAPGPGPMKIPEEQARPMLGLREVRYTVGTAPLAVVESTLA
ncbi:MAG TPA: metallophosphoesterase [Streptosporangiaceae bacterium]|nr:metallophosphoesterase [Streptosporangiaceae bacterium]